jgi:hypothetical protein
MRKNPMSHVKSKRHAADAAFPDTTNPMASDEHRRYNAAVKVVVKPIRKSGVGGAASAAAVGDSVRPLRVVAAAGDEHPRNLPRGWSEHVHTDGGAYYYNENTKETTWEKPKFPDHQSSTLSDSDSY